MISARELARLEKQRKLATMLREKADAEANDVDAERKKNWEWTIEENDAWEKKLKRKARRADFEFHGSFANALCPSRSLTVSLFN
jgi:pre-mRNA-splicing factor SYF2